MKICVVGPCRTGKTYLCQLLAEQTLPPPGYNATEGVRIQEIERSVKMERCRAQLWDCSGDQRFSRLWGGMSAGLHGLVMVYDADVDSEAELEKWYQAFAQPHQLSTSQVAILAVSTNGSTSGGHSMKGKLSRLRQAFVALPEGRPDVDTLGREIDAIIGGILSRKADADQEQLVDESEF